MTTSPQHVPQRSMRSTVPPRHGIVGARTGAFALAASGCLAIVLGASSGRLGADRALAPAIAVLRIASMLGGTYLVGVMAVGAFLRVVRAPARVMCAVDRATPWAVRRLLDLSLATSLAMSAAVVGASALPVGATGIPRPTLAGRPATAGDPSSGQRWPRLPDPPGTSPTARKTVAAVTIPPVTDAPRSTSLPKLTGPSGPPSVLNIRVAHAPSGPAVPAVPVAPLAAEHVVSAGESFWSIAEEHILALDPHAGEARIAAYWHRLQHANLDRMPIKDQPDMLYAGIHLRLPDVVSPRRPPLANVQTSQAR